MFAGLIGTIIGGVALYYLPGVISSIAKRISSVTADVAAHLDKEFPTGTATFHKPNEK